MPVDLPRLDENFSLFCAEQSVETLLLLLHVLEREVSARGYVGPASQVQLATKGIRAQQGRRASLWMNCDPPAGEKLGEPDERYR